RAACRSGTIPKHRTRVWLVGRVDPEPPWRWCPVNKSLSTPSSLAHPAPRQHRKQLPYLVLARHPAVFADLEGLGVLDLLRLFGGVPRRELAPKPPCRGGEAVGELVAHLLLAAGHGRAILGIGHEVRAAVAAAFVELRLQGFDHLQL